MKKKIIIIALVVSFALSNFFIISIIIQGGFVSSRRTPQPNINYKELLNYMNNNASYVGSHFSNNEIYIHIDGHRTFKLADLSEILNSTLHISEELSLYSLEWVNSLLRDTIIISTEQHVEEIVNSVKSTINFIEKKSLLPQPMKVNDHVVSDRMEMLILLVSFLKEEYPYILTTNLNNKLISHIHWCYKLLTDKKRFNWKTNHGLMQLRALLFYNYAYSDNPKNLDTRNANEFSNEIIPYLLVYHIAHDGSVYESASNYWYYIYNQWKLISEFPGLNNELRSTITERLNKTNDFLNTVTMPNGFLQGVGDAVNSYKNPENINYSSYLNTLVGYRFENRLAGLNYFNESNIFSLYFTSLYNPPSVHKHPEDLSVYLYLNGPFFTNPGVYGYDNSAIRKYLISQEAQNTVFYENSSLPDSSIVYPIITADKQITLTGRKYYGNDFIQRSINFLYHNNMIEITDSASNINRKMITIFNLHPDITTHHNSSHNYSLSNSKVEISFSSSNAIELDSGIISQSINKINNIARFKIKADSAINIISITTPKIFNTPTCKLIVNNEPTSERLNISKRLRENYKSHLFYNQSNKRLLYPRVLFLLSFIVFSFAFIFLLQSQKILYYTSIIYTIIYIIDVICDGIILSLSFL